MRKVCWKERSMFLKFARCLVCCFVPRGRLWVPGTAAGGAAGPRRGSGAGLSALEEVVGSGRVKLQQCAELCQLRNNGAVCSGLARYQAKVLWCEFICWLFPLCDVMLSVSAIFITPSSVAGTCSCSQPQKVWKQLLNLICILSADLWHNPRRVGAVPPSFALPPCPLPPPPSPNGLSNCLAFISSHRLRNKSQDDLCPDNFCF